jgi:hypothetical protein
MVVRQSCEERQVGQKRINIDYLYLSLWIEQDIQ